jgi:myo-inositol-1(or 4)-monophosphatase
MASLERLLPQPRTLLRIGSAALILCYVAAGRIDGYWASSLNLWDRAAGELLVGEAGGVVTDLDGGPLNVDDRMLLAAGDAVLHARLRSEIAAVRVAQGLRTDQ